MAPENTEDRKPRPYIGILFNCCHVYTRIYLNRAKTAYTGACPKCARPFTIKVARGGSRSRFWTAE